MTIPQILGLNCGIADWVADYDQENAALMHTKCPGCSCECHWELEDEEEAVLMGAS